MKKRVLIIDDDAATRRLLTDIVSEFDVEVREAAKDDEAYRLFIETGPDLIFLDVLLPKHGGIQLLKDIRRLRGGAGVPVLMMSAVYRGADLRNEVLSEVKFVEFLKKPFQLDVLHARLSELLTNEHEQLTETATPFAPIAPINEGNLKTTDFPVVLKELAYQKTTACLHLQSGGRKKVIFFRDGEVCFVSSNQLRETLGRYLLDTGAISDNEYQLGLEAITTGSVKLGEFLIKNGYLEAQELFEAVRGNIFEKLMDLFTWREADFHVLGYRESPAVLPGRPFEVSHILREGVRTRYPYDLMSAAMTPHEDLVLLAQRDFFELAAEIPLDKDDLQTVRLLRRLRGSSLRLVVQAMEGEREVRFLYYLLLAGYMTLGREDVKGAEGRKLEMADVLRVRKARRRLDVLQSRNHFQVLGAPLDATDEKVREAYLFLAKDVHPDMLGEHELPQLKQIHASIFQLIRSSYEALKTEKKRLEYLKFIRENLDDHELDGARIVEAESLFQEGRALMKKRQWAEAVAALRRAVEINPNEGEFVLFLGISLSRRSSKTVEEANEIQDLFKKARALLPASPEPNYRLGLLDLQLGDFGQAATHFKAALARDRNHVESLRELRLMKMRKSNWKGGVLSGLLGKGR